eukprot:UN13495
MNMGHSNHSKNILQVAALGQQDHACKPVMIYSVECILAAFYLDINIHLHPLHPDYNKSIEMESYGTYNITTHLDESIDLFIHNNFEYNVNIQSNNCIMHAIITALIGIYRVRKLNYGHHKSYNPFGNNEIIFKSVKNLFELNVIGIQLIQSKEEIIILFLVNILL